jgi:hypothetical protein
MPMLMADLKVQRKQKLEADLTIRGIRLAFAAKVQKHQSLERVV